MLANLTTALVPIMGALCECCTLCPCIVVLFPCTCI